MTKLGRNELCHCGSGKKYKKCHLAQDEATARAARPRLVDQGNERSVVSGTPDAAALELAEQYSAERDAGRGPAQQMMEFAEPLIESSDATPEGINKAMSLAMIFWNLAITPEEGREDLLTEMSDGVDPEIRSDFLATAKEMIARHEGMFPELHKPR